MSKITKKVYPVMGMHCAACANNVEKIVKKQEGVEDASVNLAAAVLTVDFNSDVVSPEQLKDAVMKIGFDLIIDEDNSMEEQEEAEHGNVFYGFSGHKLVDACVVIACAVLFRTCFLC